MINLSKLQRHVFVHRLLQNLLATAANKLKHV